MLDARIDPNRIEAGCDEVGRGCLAGPVAAAAVILPADFRHPLVIDSKKLSPARRAEARLIIETEAIDWKVAFVSPKTIDRINILNASFLGMSRAVKRLQHQPEHLLIDGNRFRSALEIPFTCIVKGDAKNASIAAASILAKCYRDEYMARLAQAFPGYGWERNAGYPTPEHKRAIAAQDATEHHRRSFKWTINQT